MLGALFNLAQMRSKAKSYKGMAEVSRINAQAARAQGRSQAKSIRETAAKNQEIEAQVQRTAQENAYKQIESIRTSQAGSGFTAEGSVTEKRIAAQQALNQQIANMAMSASISMSNSWQQATDVERQAEARAINYEGQAAAYAAASKGVRQGMILAAAGGMVGMGLSIYRAEQENAEAYDKAFAKDKDGNYLKDEEGNYIFDQKYYDAHKKNVALAATAGADIGFGVGGIINPYTAALTGDANARKNNWQSFFALTYGNIPYNPEINKTLDGGF